MTVNNAERVGLWDDRKNAPVQIADDDVGGVQIEKLGRYTFRQVGVLCCGKSRNTTLRGGSKNRECGDWTNVCELNWYHRQAQHLEIQKLAQGSKGHCETVYDRSAQGRYPSCLTSRLSFKS